MADAELKEYNGSCHCGKFKYTVKMPEIKEASVCDCSICVRKGYIWSFIQKSNLTTTGEENLTSYLYGTKSFAHQFCGTCGTAVKGVFLTAEDPEKSVVVNFRSLNLDFDIDDLKTNMYKGSEHGLPYVLPDVPGFVEGTVDGDKTLQKGSCHCGAVGYTVLAPALADTKVMQCNCSLCARNGDRFIYPPKAAVTLHGAENLTGYAFLSDEALHSFCKTCGVSVVVQVAQDDDCPINIRTLHEVSLAKLGELQYTRYDGKSKGAPYAPRF